MNHGSNDERRRLRALKNFRILDSGREEVFDRIALLAAQLCGTPIGLVSFIDADRQWCKACHGFDMTTIPRDLAFCKRVVEACDLFAVVDTLEDSEFAGHPLVVGKHGVRSYAGVPLLDSDGLCIGSVAVFDTCPREFEKQQIAALRTLSELTMDLLDQRRRDLEIESELAITSDFQVSEERFRRMLEYLPDVVVLYGSDLRIKYVNAATTAVSGMQPAELVGKRDAEVFPGPEHEPVLELLHQARRTGLPQTKSVDLNLPRTGRRHLLITCIPLLDDAGEVIEIIGITRDLTEQLEQSKQLALVQAAVASIDDIILVVDRDGSRPRDVRIAYVNPAFERLTGYAGDEVIGKSLDLLHGPETQAEVVDHLYKAFDDGRPVRVEIIDHKKSGDPFWLEINAIPLVDDSGQVTRFVSVERDITIRKQAEQALKASEERYRLLFESNPHPMWVFDLETLRFLAVNDAAVAHYGYSRQKFMSMTIEQIRPEEDIPRLHKTLKETAHRGFDESGVWRHCKADGQIIEVRISSHGLIFDGRKAELILAQDVTDQRRLEEQLRQGQRLESIGQLTGGIAHDFNNLLTVILGNAELLEEQLQDRPDLRNLAAMMCSAARRGADLTGQLLAFARRQALEPESTDIAALIDGMKALLRRTISADIELRLAHAPDLWRANIDAGQLESALLNLVLNARDAMHDGGHLLIETSNVNLDEDVSSQADLKPGEYVQIAVSDTGCGIEKDNLDRIFDPFFSTKAKGKGTGMGLPMVYGFIKQSRGHIRVYSEPGSGTTLRMYLPRSTDLPAAGEPPHAEPDAGAIGHEHILVVEDDELVREYVERLLSSLGYRVSSAMDGDQALTMLNQDVDIDLLFTDVIMPGSLKGPELADKAIELHPSLKILFTSGYTENALIHHGRVDQGIQLLQKPYSRVELAAKVRAVLDSA